MSSENDKAHVKIAKFNIGEVVIHQRQGYRAVIIDIDPLFQPSGRYNPQSCKRDFSKQNPWYRLLVDGCSQETYVEEPLLREDHALFGINNPLVAYYLVLKENKYQTILHRH